MAGLRDLEIFGLPCSVQVTKVHTLPDLHQPTKKNPKKYRAEQDDWRSGLYYTLYYIISINNINITHYIILYL